MDIIFDIDGTLADCSHRLHFIQSKSKNWKAFFDGMEHDIPIEPTCKIAYCIHRNYNNIIFCTGRPETHRKQTRMWLAQRLGEWTDGCRLFMCQDGDHRPDYEAKEEMLQKIRDCGLDPKVAFEDRDQVVDMWRRNGLICYQVSNGAY